MGAQKYHGHVFVIWRYRSFFKASSVAQQMEPYRSLFSHQTSSYQGVS